MISTNSPCARRMPVFTAAPLPLLYGWRTTDAPAALARAAVSSLDPSSTTMISRHPAASRRRDTTPPMASASSMAGMTIETVDVSAKQLLDHAVPRNGAGVGLSRFAEALRERGVGRDGVDGRGDRQRIG